MAGPVVKGDLDIATGVISSRRTNQASQTITTAITETIKSQGIARVTGTAALIITLPDATSSSIPQGWTKRYINTSANTVTFRLNGTTTDLTPTLGGNLTADVMLVGVLNNAASWRVSVIDSGGAAANYCDTFTATDSAWVRDTGAGTWTITVAVGTHSRGLDPVVKVQQSSGTTPNIIYEDLLVETKTEEDGDVLIVINDSPGEQRFAGRYIIV